MKIIAYYLNNVILFIWQLPQNIAGLLVIFFTQAKKDELGVYLTRFNFGVSLGKYIIINEHCRYKDVLHEKGHQRQSLYFGWTYLIIIGITSALFNNVWDRIAHKKWSYEKRIKWYYNRFPEKWADKLGGIYREA